ncbi:MAG: hypothetical protein E7582_07660 [Ruminococcaceae bacterium]|nr:hypothetical protein [Oscillospiraceae bacterium]
MNKRKTKGIAFSGLSVALIIVLFFISSIFDVLDYTACAFAGLIVTFILVEFGTSLAVAVYFASSILSLLLVPSKFTILLFIFFCGWYSFVKRFIERIREPFCMVIKFAVFNVALLCVTFITSKLLLLEVEVLWYVLVFLLANVTFYLYDLLITRLIWIYVHKYRKKLKFLN